MSNWNNSYIDIDILLYGCLCTPCLFGENTYIVNPRSSCPFYAISYSVISLSAQMLGLLMGKYFNSRRSKNNAIMCDFM